ncbi:MAG: hypothetical protein QW405_01395 [Fervidicoccaceae archaeon]
MSEALIEEVERVVEEALSWAKTSTRIVEDFLLSVERPVVSYSGLGIVPAKTFANAARTLTQEPWLYALPASEVAVHVAPYREWRYAVLHFMVDPWGRSETARLADVLYLMEVPALYVLPESEELVLAQKIPEGSALRVPANVDVLSHEVLLAATSSVSFSAKRAKRGDLRISRLMSEFSDMRGIAREVSERYSDFLREVSSLVEHGRRLTILYSSIMEPAALSLVRALRRRVCVELFELNEGLPLLSRGDRVLIVCSSTEESSCRDAKFRAAHAGFEVRDLVFGTDPLSAVIYCYILSLLVERVIGLKSLERLGHRF